MLTPTPAQEWRKVTEVGFPVKFPSGFIAQIRPMHLGTILLLGYVPDGMVQAVMDVLSGKSDDLPKASTPEEIRDRFQFMDNVCRSCFVSPKIVDNPEADDEISINHLEVGDRQFATMLLNLPASELARFRQEQGTDVESVDKQPRPQKTA